MRGVLSADCGRDDGDGSRYVFVPISAGDEHPTLESVNRLTHEHELKSYLDSGWALRPLELVRERGQMMLVVDYTGGEPLDRLIREPMEVGEFLRLSVALSGAVGRLRSMRLTRNISARFRENCSRWNGCN